MAEREKAIELIGAAQAGEKEALRLKLAVDAEKDAAEGRGTVVRMQAEADAQAELIRIQAARERAEMEATAQRQMNEAHNVLSPEARVSGFRYKLLDKVEGIVRESVRPLEHIESIKILSVDGLGGQVAAASSDAGGALSDQVVDADRKLTI